MRTYKIGAFARFTQTPVKTLRYYAELGLLLPAHTDPRTGYRFYTAAQVERLNRILVFKDLGFSLGEIRGLLADRVSAATIRAMIERKHDELARQVAHERARLARAAARLARISDAHAIALRSTGPQLVAAVRETLSDHAECTHLFAELRRHCGAAATGQRAAIWHVCTASGVECEAVVFLAAPVAPTERVRVYELPGGRVASLVYRRDDDFLPAYRAIRAWLAASGATVVGAKRELFLEDRDAEESVTEIQFPIAAEAA